MSESKQTTSAPAVRKVPAITAATAHLKIAVRKSERYARDENGARTENVTGRGYYVRVTSDKSKSKGLDFSESKWALYNMTCEPIPEFKNRVEFALQEAKRLTENDPTAKRERKDDSKNVLATF